ncbi:MAG: hypothetical protein ACP6IY_04730 [Promethearchaeia archaeon]
MYNEIYGNGNQNHSDVISNGEISLIPKEDINIENERYIEENIDEMIEDIKNFADYGKFKEILMFLIKSNLILSQKVTLLQNELNKIKEEIYQNELTVEDFEDIMQFDYEDD